MSRGRTTRRAGMNRHQSRRLFGYLSVERRSRRWFDYVDRLREIRRISSLRETRIRPPSSRLSTPLFITTSRSSNGESILWGSQRHCRSKSCRLEKLTKSAMKGLSSVLYQMRIRIRPRWPELDSMFLISLRPNDVVLADEVTDKAVWRSLLGEERAARHFRNIEKLKARRTQVADDKSSERAQVKPTRPCFTANCSDKSKPRHIPLKSSGRQYSR